MAIPVPHLRTETLQGYAPAREVLRRPTLGTEVPSLSRHGQNAGRKVSKRTSASIVPSVTARVVFLGM